MSKQKLVVNNFEHGGSRMYLEDIKQTENPLGSPKRDLVVDCFQDKEFSDWIEDCVYSYFKQKGIL